MKYFITLFLFLVFSTASVANDHVPVGKLSSSTQPVCNSMLTPSLEEVELSTTDKVVTLFWDNDTRSYEKAALLPLSDMDAMLEKAEAQKTIEKEYGEMKGIIESMSVEFNKKYLSYNSQQDSLSKASKQLLEQELQDMQNRIMQYQTNAEAQLAKRQEELLQPIIGKAETAIKSIATKEGFLYIFDTSTGSQILFHSDKSIDVMPMVKKELGIQ